MDKLGFLRSARLGPIDFALSGLASLLAVFSMGEGLGESPIGRFFAIGIILATPLAYFLQRMLRDEVAGYVGATLYAVAVIAGFVLARPLNNLLPLPGIEPQLALAGRMSFMLMFGSLFAWRDGTLLFQAVPSIALFGMVGSWDTFGEAPIAFFAFLLCIATLFARVHLRTMANQAANSGYPNLSDIHKGPWRWMAGPEWALASAAAIILISVVGAPIIQESVRTVSDTIKFNIPSPTTRAARGNSSNMERGDFRSVGIGPSDLTDEIRFYAGLDKPRYLRTYVYHRYTGRGWQSRTPSDPEQARKNADYAVSRIQNSKQVSFDIELVSGMHRKLPAPGEVVQYDSSRIDRLGDGTLAFQQLRTSARVRGISVVAPGLAVAGTALAANANSEIGRRTLDLTLAVTNNAKTDFEKAQAIKREIESRVVYNLEADAQRTDDVVETFLFESKEGYCDLFASSMAVMAQAAGMRSRYVTGYFPVHEEKGSDGRYIIRANEAHAWAEIFFENVGWVPFDATEGAREVEGAGRGDSRRKPWYTNPWLIGLLAVAGVTGLWLSFPWLAAFVRRIRNAAPSPRYEAGRLYWAFARALEKNAGRPRRLSETPDEYLDVVSEKIGSIADEARPLNDKLVLAMYGPAEVGKADVAILRKELQSFRKLRPAK
ncbi:MAG: transglutaminaseTgpA domain-containing protein [Fimbriimonadaceae bacterium]